MLLDLLINDIIANGYYEDMQGEKRIEKYQFNMKNILGTGSYATVYRGKVIGSTQEVAIKVIDKKLFLNAYNLKNIQSEVEIMKQVNHQNIVKLYDIFQTANNMYIITECCDGGDLLVELRKRKKISEIQAKKYLNEIMKGAKYLHSKGIIHRDLKPANILLKNGVCKISDFGFAKSLEQENAIMKSIVGTPLYMSPQLLKRSKYTNKSDLWSIGLIYYEMIHGRTPWPAKNQLQLVNGIYGKPVLFSKEVSDRSKDFIRRCLQVQEEERMSWEDAFEHRLLNERRIFSRDSPFDEKENAINSSNVSDLSSRIRKDLSQIRLKKIEAMTPKHSNLTPKASKTPTNKNTKLRHLLAVTPTRDMSEKRRKLEKDVSARKFK